MTFHNWLCIKDIIYVSYHFSFLIFQGRAWWPKEDCSIEITVTCNHHHLHKLLSVNWYANGIQFTSSANLLGSRVLCNAPVISSNRLSKWIRGADVKQESVSLSCPLSHNSSSNRTTSSMCWRVPRCMPSSSKIPNATCWSETGTESSGLQYTLSSFPFLPEQDLEKKNMINDVLLVALWLQLPNNLTKWKSNTGPVYLYIETAHWFCFNHN